MSIAERNVMTLAELAAQAPVVGEPEIINGFLKLTRGSDIGTPKGPVYVQVARIEYVERESWAGVFTRVHLAGDVTVRVVESPEQILEALG